MDIYVNDIITIKQFDKYLNRTITIFGSVKSILKNNKIKIMIFDKTYGRKFGLFNCPLVVHINRILSINGKKV